MNRSTSLLLWFGLILAASIALYRTSDRVQELDRQLHDINVSIEAEQQSIHVLKAEWVYLANPERVETLANKYIPSLQPTATKQVTSLASLEEVLPTRTHAMAAVAVTATPIATIRTSLLVPSTRHPAPVPSPRRKVATVTLASADTGHLNDHMIIERTASAQDSPNSIGELLTRLDAHP